MPFRVPSFIALSCDTKLMAWFGRTRQKVGKSNFKKLFWTVVFDFSKSDVHQNQIKEIKVRL